MPVVLQTVPLKQRVQRRAVRHLQHAERQAGELSMASFISMQSSMLTSNN